MGHQFFGFNASKRFKLLERLFNKPKYIIFFREPSSIIYSGYFQGLKKLHNLKFKNYIYKNHNDLKSRNFRNLWSRGLDYKIFNYNKILRDFLKIQNRVLFIEHETFFKDKKINKLKKFTKINFKFNWNLRINISPKKLKYLEIYNKSLIFIITKFIWLKINRNFFRKRKAVEISNQTLDLINFFIKFTPIEKLKKLEDKHNNLLKQIKKYHSKNYSIFKNKLKSDHHIISN